jgi:hypothetical protein
MISSEKVVTYNELKSVLMEIEVSKETNLKYNVLVDMNKGKTDTGEKIPNPYYGTRKLVNGNFKVGNYKKRVINNGEKEGFDMSDFEPEKPKGKHHISFCVLQNDTDENVHYLGYESVQGFSKPKVEYYFEGVSIEKHLFQQWMKKEYSSNTQPQNNEVIWRTIDLRNIKEMTLNSIRYIVQD